MSPGALVFGKAAFGDAEHSPDRFFSVPENQSHPAITVTLNFTLSQCIANRVSSFDPVFTGRLPLFGLVAPSVFMVESMDRAGTQVVSSGSGVVVESECVITNSHVVENAFSIRLKSVEKSWPATVSHKHPQLDLCQLRVANLIAPAVLIRHFPPPVIGERVYAVGAPSGLEDTLSEGIVSGLRDSYGFSIIQTTAAISGGSSGGGLFDCHGKLIGITTSYIRGSQNLNFALPVSMLSSLIEYPVAAKPIMAELEEVPAFLSPADVVHRHLNMKFPNAAFDVHADREFVIHVKWQGEPSPDQIRDFLRSLILRRELPNPEFEFEHS